MSYEMAVIVHEVSKYILIACGGFLVAAVALHVYIMIRAMRRAKDINYQQERTRLEEIKAGRTDTLKLKRFKGKYRRTKRG